MEVQILQNKSWQSVCLDCMCSHDIIIINLIFKNTQIVHDTGSNYSCLKCLPVLCLVFVLFSLTPITSQCNKKFVN